MTPSLVLRGGSAAAMSVALVGCGGGGGGSGAVSVVAAMPTPTPTPAPTPTSTPTPTPTPAPVTLATFASGQLNAYESQLGYYRSDTAIKLGQAYNPTALVIGYSPGFVSYRFEQSYLLPLPVYPIPVRVDFSRNNEIAGSSAAFMISQSVQQGATYTLRLLVPGSDSAPILLNYVTIGAIRTNQPTQTEGLVGFEDRIISFGIPAQESATPASGTPRYSGIVIGKATSDRSSAVYDVTGSVTLDVDFARKTYTGTVTLTGTDDRTGAVVPFGSYPIGPAAGSVGVAVIDATVGGGDNRLRGILAGPTAEEFAGTFSLSIPDPRTAGRTLKIAAAAGARR